MSQLLQIFIWIPLIAFAVSLMLPRKNESLISGLVISTVSIHFIIILGFFIVWLLQGFPTLDVRHITFYKSGNIDIFINFYFDNATAAFCLVGSTIAIFVSVFSKYYMHRDEGFKRYFATLLFFFFGYNLIIFSGNFETLFIGWEILGICSFILIAFYRDRYLPVKNGLKVISFFRFADVCLVLAMWMSHHLWHENITFLKLNDSELVAQQISGHYSLGVFIVIMIVLAAVIKSAQLPFSSWLPRAMEGPTSSSAIFYGSLSVHLGVFLLLRTYPFWESIMWVKPLLIVIGLATAVIATSISRVQSTVKTQIAYSSAAQIGLMFIEVALGLHILALIHFAGNAFLRTYQLLVSPSVLSYLAHDQFYHFNPSREVRKPLSKLATTLYMLSIKEFNLDSFHYSYLWQPFKWIGKKFSFLSSPIALILLAVIFVAGAYFVANNSSYDYLPHATAFIAAALILKAFTHRGQATEAWWLLFASQFFIALAMSLNSEFDLTQTLMYLSGGFVFSIIGYICLVKIRSLESDINLDKFHGHAYEYRRLARVFFISCLGIVAFPITPAFIGFDVIITNIHADQYALIGFVSICFIFIELSALRIYARIFMGQHKKTYHAMAFRSS